MSMATVRHEASAIRRSTRRTMTVVATGFGLVLLVLVLTSWRIAGQRVRDTEGLVAQGQLLIAVFQASLGLAVALATIYYAGLTRETVESIHEGAELDRICAVEALVNDLAGSTLAMAAQAGHVATLMRSSWRWYLPGPARTRNTMLIQGYPRLLDTYSSVTRSADLLQASRPDLAFVVDDLLERSEAIFLGASTGDSAELEADARQLRQSIERLRSMALPPHPQAV